ncbi:hypothetical protein LUX73_10970 [Actinomadura madurae]|nr:hypothetical protein [Actinomadura madurae]MCQ0005152.1 hypothetical protein [Actinomadura madurae]
MSATTRPRPVDRSRPVSGRDGPGSRAVHLLRGDGHDERAGGPGLDDAERRRRCDESAGPGAQARLAAVLLHQQLAVQRQQEAVAAVAAGLPGGADVVGPVREVEDEPVGGALPDRPAEHVVHRSSADPSRAAAGRVTGPDVKIASA